MNIIQSNINGLMNFLQYIFSSFWIFTGFTILLVIVISLVSDFITDIIKAFRNPKKSIESYTRHILEYKGFIHKGYITRSDTPTGLPREHKKGEIFSVSKELTFGETKIFKFKPGDLIMCISSGTVDNINDWIFIFDK